MVLGLNGLAVSESAADSRHNLVLVGTANLATMAVVKYGPGGGRAWVRFYDDPASSNENATHVAVDAAGNIYVTGDTMPGGADEDVILLKYSPAGVLRWVRHYSPAGLNQDSPRDIDVDAAGNVYVTARGSVSANGSDILTLKYDPAGHRRWARTDGPGAGNDYPEAMAVTDSAAFSRRAQLQASRLTMTPSSSSTVRPAPCCGAVCARARACSGTTRRVSSSWATATWPPPEAPTALASPTMYSSRASHPVAGRAGRAPTTAAATNRRAHSPGACGTTSTWREKARLSAPASMS